MKKITQKKISKNLAKYGALTIALAGIADASGQIVFTDVDPDFVGGATDTFAIDFNNDGTIDANIVQLNNGNYELVQANVPDGNAVLVTTNGAGAYLYGVNFAAGETISAGAAPATGSFGSFCAGPGYTGSEFCDTTDGFVGIQFEVDGGTHFGWVGVDVGNSSSFTVRGYAFEATPDTPIEAGAVLSLEDNTIEGFSSFVKGDVLTLNARTPMESLTIHNISGQELISRKLSNTSELIDLSAFSTGVYVATVTIEGKAQAIKFVK